MEKIKEVICPTCRKSLMYLHYEMLPFMDKKIPTKFICLGGCVITYQFDWFDRFDQYEFLVLRNGGFIEDWLKHLKKDKKSKYKIKYRISNRDGRKTNRGAKISIKRNG